MTEPPLFLDTKPIATGAMNRSKYFLSFIAPVSLMLVVIACGSETASSPSNNQPDAFDPLQQASGSDSSPSGNSDSYGSGSAMTDDEKTGESGDPVSSDDLLNEATPISRARSSGSTAQQSTSPEPVDPPEASQPDPDPAVTQPVVDFAPDFHLASVQGPAHRLSDYRDNQPVVVVFYRAFW
ncbi:MAG: hypothetical protein ACPHK0_04305 [Dehalococcoidia bacterium]